MAQKQLHPAAGDTAGRGAGSLGRELHEDTPSAPNDQFPIIIARLDKNRREQLRIAINQFQGLTLIDLRVTVDLTEASGIQTPTKKGV